jgi:hypothetical protein
LRVGQSHQLGRDHGSVRDGVLGIGAGELGIRDAKDSLARAEIGDTRTNLLNNTCEVTGVWSTPLDCAPATDPQLKRPTTSSTVAVYAEDLMALHSMISSLALA